MKTYLSPERKTSQIRSIETTNLKEEKNCILIERNQR